MSNLPEIIGATTGIAGALMLAVKFRFSAWAWPLWIVSGVAWIVYANTTHAYGLMMQQLVFVTINIIGTWRWLLQPATKSGARLTGEPAATNFQPSSDRNQ